MFGAIGTFVYRMRFAVIAVFIALMAGSGLYGMDLDKNLSQSGWFDPNSESTTGAVLADAALGRDHTADLILMITPPEGTLVNDEQFGNTIQRFMQDAIAEYPDILNRVDPGIYDPYVPLVNPGDEGIREAVRERTFSPDLQHAFISIGVAGNNDDEVLANYETIEPFFEDIAGRYDLPGTNFEMAGLQPIAGSMATGMDRDIARAELIALPLVALMLFFIFGGVVAAVLPVLIGGLTIAGSMGIMKVLTHFTEVNIFAQPVVTLIGLGIAIDYGLFIVSRFREEIAEGYSTRAAVRRSVMTAGQTVVFSATIVVAALACLLIMPHGFLRSVAYGAVSAVSLAAILSVTVLPAILAILGPRIDALGFKFLKRTKTREEVENGFWGKLSAFVMRHPVATSVPTILLLLALTIPFSGIKFGGLSETYLPEDNPNRVAQEHFDEVFPAERTEEVKIIVAYNPATDGEKLGLIAQEANAVPGFTRDFDEVTDSARYNDTWNIYQMGAGLVNREDGPEAIRELRAIDDQGLNVFVTGTPALTQDSIDTMMDRLPLMALLLVLVTGFLMFLAFGSLVLPIKAALSTALSLGASLGILTWIFVDGNLSGIANFTPGPMFAGVLVLIIAIIFGLSTDYEVFLLSRMVEARQKGASTTEAVRVGTAHTGRIITAAAAILIVVTGAFGFSEIVMMKYIAYGMIAALILDATIVRMLLVPSTMKLLGDDCWWAPRWMRTMQRKIGLGEKVLDDEPDEMRDGVRKGHRSAGTVVAEEPTAVMAAAGRGAGAATATATLTRSGDRRRPGPEGPHPDVTNPEQTGANRAGPQRVGPDGRRQVPGSRNTGPQGTGPQPRPQRPGGPPPGPRGATPYPGTPRPDAPRPDATRPDVPRRVIGAGAGVAGDPTPARTEPGPRFGEYKKKSDGPDTGGWRLGEGGISLGDQVSPRPSAPHPAQRPAQRPTPPRPETPQGSPLGRRPELDDTGKRPLAASLSPEEPRPEATRPTSRQDPARSNGQAQRSEDDQPKRARRGRGADRHARESSDETQISVQELLRRSRDQ